MRLGNASGRLAALLANPFGEGGTATGFRENPLAVST